MLYLVTHWIGSPSFYFFWFVWSLYFDEIFWNFFCSLFLHKPAKSQIPADPKGKEFSLALEMWSCFGVVLSSVWIVVPMKHFCYIFIFFYQPTQKIFNSFSLFSTRIFLSTRRASRHFRNIISHSCAVLALIPSKSFFQEWKFLSHNKPVIGAKFYNTRTKKINYNTLNCPSPICLLPFSLFINHLNFQNFWAFCHTSMQTEWVFGVQNGFKAKKQV